MHQIEEIGRVNENGYIKARIRRIRYLFILIGFLLVMLITATYAWFATQRDVSINNLKSSIEVSRKFRNISRRRKLVTKNRLVRNKFKNSISRK